MSEDEVGVHSLLISRLDGIIWRERSYDVSNCTTTTIFVVDISHMMRDIEVLLLVASSRVRESTSERERERAQRDDTRHAENKHTYIHTYDTHIWLDGWMDDLWCARSNSCLREQGMTSYVRGAKVQECHELDTFEQYIQVMMEGSRWYPEGRIRRA